jgi:hypothetical protein
MTNVARLVLFWAIGLSELHLLRIFGVPKNVVAHRRYEIRALACRLYNRYQAANVLRPKYLVQDGAHTVEVLIADLDKDAARCREQFLGSDESVSKIRKVRVSAEGPRVPVCANHLGLTCKVLIAVLNITLTNLWQKIR